MGGAVTAQTISNWGSNRPLDLIVGGSSYYYHQDVLGSTTTLADASGNVAASYHYDAYGNLQQSADSIGNPLRYTATPYDATTGLIADGARFYDPSTGRFLSPDPAGSSGSSAYAYANDNPTNLVDPSGRSPMPPFLIEGGDGGQGCTMTLYRGAWCVFGVRAKGSVETFSWDRCAHYIALFVAGLVLSIADT